MIVGFGAYICSLAVLRQTHPLWTPLAITFIAPVLQDWGRRGGAWGFVLPSVGTYIDRETGGGGLWWG